MMETERDPAWLMEHRHDVTSQYGEDGVLKKVLEALPERDKWCVEFGAWDGIHYSNTRQLVLEQDYAVVLIEADPVRYEDLQGTYKGHEKAHLFQEFVGFTPKDGLDTILKKTPIPKDFDLLSIDIDGNDYHVWNAVGAYTPKVVIIEFNPTVPASVSFIQPAETPIAQGNSLKALVDLGKEKGYELVCVLDSNAIFVRAEYFPAFGISDNSIASLWKTDYYVTHIFFGYDGTVHLEGHGRMNWHNIKCTEADVQLLPGWLRRHPTRLSPVQGKCLYLFRKLPRFLRRILSTW